jgi:hypothetical protein
MVLKGAALVSLHYPDSGLRPMADTDVLVPTRHARPVMDLLMARGWVPVGMAPEARRPELTLSVRHAHEFRHPSGQDLDLHWNVFWECCAPDADDEFWAAAVPLEIRGVRTRALCPTDQLLHVCVHGARWNVVPSLRWAADALMVLRTSGVGIDWDRLVDQSRRRGLVLPMRDTLTFLVDVLHAPVPLDVLTMLCRSRVSWIEHTEYRAGARAPRLWRALPLRFCHHVRLSRGQGVARALLGFPRYLRLSYEQDGVWDLARVIRGKLRARRSARRRPNRGASRAGLPRARDVDRTSDLQPGSDAARSWLDRPQWMPVDAPTRSDPSARDRDGLLAVIGQFQVETTWRYRPTPTKRGRNTWCNIFVWDVTRALGAEVPHCVDEAGRPTAIGQGKELTANGTLRWLEMYGPAHGWREEDAPAAARAAEAGWPTLAIWHNPFGHGHIALVVTGPDGNVHIAQAGADCFSNRPLAHGFGDRPVRFFVHA